jgi:tetratricopeptide (TPR) repeat protein
VQRQGSVRGFSIGVAALLEDLGVDQAAKGWAGSPPDLARAARLKQTLAAGQARAGHLEQACATVEGVARIYRRLGNPEPARYHPELALALTAWGLWSSRLARWDEATAELSEAVELYRELLGRAGRQRVMHRIRLRSGLAVALSNLGTALSESGRHDAATEAAEESVAVLRRLRARNPVYRMLARSNPVAFEHGLAAALNNLGLVLAARGDRERACELAASTAASYRRLAELAPVVFESELARALHNLGLAANEVGQSDTALAATREAVRLHRELLLPQRSDQRQDLARALCAFARVRVSGSAELDEALDAAHDAVGLLEQLTEARPETFTGDLHVAYQTVSLVRDARRGPGEGRGRGPLR